MVKEKLCHDREILCRDRVCQVGRISVATEEFYVTIELATIENSAAHDRVGCAKASGHDSVASCCVVTEEAMRA